MKISIVTISYNQVRFLERAILSVIKQSYSNIEYIVVDPGSTDGSREVIERYRSNIAKIIYEPDDGPADGLNKGFSQASGEIFGYINADDELMPGALKKVADYFSCNHRHIDVVSGNGFIIDERGQILKKIISTTFTIKAFTYGAVTFMQQATFIRQDAFWEAGGFNSLNRTCWDAELMTDIAILGKNFDLLNAELALFRMHNLSIGSSVSRSIEWKEKYKKDTNRLFRKVIGREKNFTDIFISNIFRIKKWLTHPGAFFFRLASKLGMKPQYRKDI